MQAQEIEDIAMDLRRHPFYNGRENRDKLLDYVRLVLSQPDRSAAIASMKRRLENLENGYLPGDDDRGEYGVGGGRHAGDHRSGERHGGNSSF